MNYLDFFAYLYTRQGEFLACVAVSLLVYYVVLRRHLYSIFDPLAYNLLNSAMAAGVLFFLFGEGLIDSFYLVSFLLTEAAFLFGATWFKPIPRQCTSEPRASAQPDVRFANLLYAVASGAFIACQITVSTLRGVPLLTYSRLAFYATGSGFGVFERIQFVTSLTTFYLLLYRWAYRGARGSGFTKLYDAFVVIALIASAVVSGARSTFLGYIFVVFFFRLLNRKSVYYPVAKDKRLGRLQWGAIVVAVLAALAVIAFQSGAARIQGDTLRALGERVVANGDVFFLGYPNHVIDTLPPRENGAVALFADALWMSRVMPPERRPPNLGRDIFNAHYSVEGIWGPQPRHNTFGLFYFGAGGAVVFSLLLGLALGYLRDRLYRHVGCGPIAGVLYMYAAIVINNVNWDAPGVLGKVDSALLVFPALLAASFVLRTALQRPSPAPLQGAAALESNAT